MLQYRESLSTADVEVCPKRRTLPQQYSCAKGYNWNGTATGVIGYKK